MSTAALPKQQGHLLLQADPAPAPVSAILLDFHTFSTKYLNWHLGNPSGVRFRWSSLHSSVMNSFTVF